MTLNTGYYLQAYTFITLILCGLVQYFTGMQSVLWIPFFLTLLMVGLMVMQTRDAPLQLDAQETIILALYFSFLVLAGASTLLQGGVTVAIVAFKNEIALSLVMICLLLRLPGIADLSGHAIFVLGVLRTNSGNDISGVTGGSSARCSAW